jgi:hypothetical protein
LAVWLLESVSEILLLTAFIFIRPSFGEWHSGTVGLALVETGPVLAVLTFLSFKTGYAITTAIFRIFWKNRKPWSYPIIASVLFAIHLEIFFVIAGTAFKIALPYLIFGPCVAFICTLVGSLILRRWTSVPPLIEEHPIPT